MRIIMAATILLAFAACSKKLTVDPNDPSCQRLNYAETIQLGETTVTTECSIVRCTDPKPTPDRDPLIRPPGSPSSLRSASNSRICP